MLFMVVEHYTAGPEPVYERAATQGRMLPEARHHLAVTRRRRPLSSRVKRVPPNAG